MDNLTHTLTAVAISRTGLNRKTRLATLGLIIASNLPDIDIISRVGGNLTYLKYHRGITHSILGVTVLAGLLAAVMVPFGRKLAPQRGKPPFNARWLFLLCWIGTGSQLLLDFMNSYGVRPFLPFSGRWYAADLLFIIDPLLLAILIIGLGFPPLLHLVTEEVGARRPSGRRGAVFCLCSLALLLGLRGFAHERVMQQLESHDYGARTPIRLGAFPSPANPFAWTGVVETRSSFYVLHANALDEDVNLDSERIYHKPKPSPALKAALKTRTGRVFSHFARFLWAHAEESGGNYQVVLRDLRFSSARHVARGFVARIVLDNHLRVESQSFSFTGGPINGGR